MPASQTRRLRQLASAVLLRPSTAAAAGDQSSLLSLASLTIRSPSDTGIISELFPEDGGCTPTTARASSAAAAPGSSFSLRFATVQGVFSEAELNQLEDVAHSRTWGRFAAAESQTTEEGLGAGIPTRYDAYRLNTSQLQHATGKRVLFGDSSSDLGMRTNYFRETYWYPDYASSSEEDVGFVLHSAKLAEAARAVFPDRPVIEPYICYGNLTFRGMFIQVHTDCPAFRGLTRATTPQWLLSVMHHSGLFDEWRVPVANGILYTQNHEGGEFKHFPQGNGGPVSVLNTAVPYPGATPNLPISVHWLIRLGCGSADVATPRTGRSHPRATEHMRGRRCGQPVPR